jgi:hypothetical protein
MRARYTVRDSLDRLALLLIPSQYLIEYLLPRRLLNDGEQNGHALNISKQAAVLLRELPQAQRQSILTVGLSHENPVVRESCKEMLDEEEG